ncbi:reverse transcriptase domain-containing protein [Tanacetum coccineum]
MSAEDEKLLKEAKKLPWEDRLVHKNWKVRNDANIDLTALFDSITDPKDPRIRELVMSSPTYPTPSNVDEECVFPSANILDYTSTLPDYFPASSGNTSPNFSNDLTKDLLASLALSPFYDNPYMKVMQAYDAIDNELPIPPQALIAPPTILPPSPVLSLSLMFDFLTFLSSREDFTT